jgi:hypothetical protein
VSSAHASIRPSLRREVRFAIGGGVLVALIAVLTSARAARVDSASQKPAPVVTIEDSPVEPPLPAPVARMGYRFGRPIMIDVVRLEPDAVEVEVGTARAFLTMQEAAAKAGVDLRIESGFRTAEEQRALFRAWRRGRGNKAARPGESNHQSGRALDIAVQSRGAFEWLEANAATFRFKRTVKGEPWHWEYVDAPIARDPTKRVAKKVKAAKPTRYGKRPAKHQRALASSRIAAVGR